jgi:PLP dependent protein
MMSSSGSGHNRIAHNVGELRGRMADAAARAGRNPEEVRLVAVTKTAGIAEMQALIECGITELGENRVEMARPKIETLGNAVRWHMIGNVQRRKARDVVALFDVVDAVDRIEVAEALQRRCEDQDRKLEVLIEVNVSGETAKHGFVPDDLPEALRAMAAFDRITVSGLMTMAPFDAPPELLRQVFGGLRELAGAHGLRELSMGMSDDFEIAIEEGATQVRIGSALFA